MRVGNWPKLPEKWGSTLFTLSSECYFIIYPIAHMPFLCHVPAPCSSAVLSPSSSIKLPHVFFLWSAVHSLSHHCTISLPTSCWNRTRREPFVSPFLVQREHVRLRMPLPTDPQALPVRSRCIHSPKKKFMKRGLSNLPKQQPMSQPVSSKKGQLALVLILLGRTDMVIFSRALGIIRVEPCSYYKGSAFLSFRCCEISGMVNPWSL